MDHRSVLLSHQPAPSSRTSDSGGLSGSWGRAMLSRGLLRHLVLRPRWELQPGRLWPLGHVVHCLSALPGSAHLVAAVGNVSDPFTRKLGLRGRVTLLRPARMWRSQGPSAKPASFLRRTQSGHWGLGRKRETTRCPWTQGPDGWAAGRGLPILPLAALTPGAEPRQASPA